MNSIASTLCAAGAAAFLLTSCGGGETGMAPPAVGAVPKGLETVKLVVPEDNPLTAEKAELGRLLFFDKRLSSDGSMACAACHLPERAWTDGKRFSTKVDGSVNTRNSPSLFNVGYQPHYYWDGRAPTLEKNIEAAWKGHMGGDPEAMAKTVAGVAAYTERFQQAFGAAPTGENIVKALASFVRSLRAGDSAYDRGELSPAAKRGQEVYQKYCAACHVGPLFTDMQFHNVGVGEQPDPGRGKIDPEKPGAFKTPSLRNVTRTAPYFHDGSVATLREAVTLMSGGGIENEHLDPILRAVKGMGKPTAQQIDDLLAFLAALESPYQHTAPAVPE